MKARLDFRMALSTQVLLTACCLALLAGCSDPEADQRATLCKGAGVTQDLLKACKRSWEEYNRIMEPIRARREREDIAAFNASLHALPSRTIPKDRYDALSLIELSKELDHLYLNEESKWSKHPLFGKRLRMDAKVQFHPTNFEDKLSEHTTLRKDDAKTTWQIEADTESLSREERAFIKDQCEYLLEACHAEIYGLIGVVTRDQLPSPGVQIEYMEISPRDPKKSP